MQVHRPHTPDPSSLPVQNRTARGAGQVSGAQAPGVAPSETTAPGGNSQVAVLHEQLRGIPDTREEVMARAREKVASGDYLTRPAAEATAEAILRSV
ncbi:MAG: hypothetical protein KF774_20185 [Planctomyces sp.]|nr:hypothetical protein [Planctomyces sp.]